MISLLQIKKMNQTKLIQTKDYHNPYLSFQFVSSVSLYTFCHAFCRTLNRTRPAVFYMRIEAVVLDQSGGGEMYRSVLKDGQSKNPVRRNSPRLSALNASKETQQKKASEGASEKEECHGDKKQGQPSKTRAGVKRKFSSLAAKHVSEVGFNKKNQAVLMCIVSALLVHC